MHALTRRTHRQNTRRKIVLAYLVATLLSVAAFNFAQNSSSFAAVDDMPGWGNDGLGVIFTDNYVTDESGNMSKQLAAAEVGDTIGYSIKLNAKKYIDGHTATSYGFGIMANEWYEILGDNGRSFAVTVNGVEISLDNDLHSTKAGQWYVLGVPWADVEMNGICKLLTSNIRPENGESEILFSGSGDCGPSEIWETDGTIKNVESIRDDAEIEASIEFTMNERLKQYAVEHDTSLTVKYFYSYYDEQTAEMVYVMDDELAQAVDEPSTEAARIETMPDTSQRATFSGWGNLLIRRVDEAGNPLEGSVIEVDGVSAKNIGGVYYADNDGPHASFRTNEYGEVLIKGLAFGEYTVREIKAPDGRELASPVKRLVDVSSQTEHGYYREQFLIENPNEPDKTVDYAQAIEYLVDGRLVITPNDAVVLMTWNNETQRYEPSYDSTAYIVPSDDGLVANISGNIITFEYDAVSDSYVGSLGDRLMPNDVALKKSGQDLLLTTTGDTDLALPGTEDDNDNVSFLKGANYYILNETGEEKVFEYDKVNDMYVHNVETDIDVGWEIIENDDKSLTVRLGKDADDTVLVYDEEQRCYVGEIEGAPNPVTKYGDHFVLAIPGIGEYRFDYDDESGNYKFLPDVGAETIRALSDGSVKYRQIQPLVHLHDNKYAMYLLFIFAITMERSYAPDTILSNEVILMDVRDTASDDIQPEFLPANPQTSDAVVKLIIAAVACVAPIALARHALSRR